MLINSRFERKNSEMNNKIPFSATEMFNGHCIHCFQEGYEQGKKNAIKYGHWISYPTLTSFLRCNQCHNGIHWDDNKKPNYCPNCGAKMIKENQ